MIQASISVDHLLPGGWAVIQFDVKHVSDSEVDPVCVLTLSRNETEQKMRFHLVERKFLDESPTDYEWDEEDIEHLLDALINEHSIQLEEADTNLRNLIGLELE